jgi:hypothetical protein
MGHQARDIHAPLPERRQGEGHDGQAVEEVLTKGAILDLAEQLHIGGRNDPDIGLPWPWGAQGMIGLILQEVQQLRLGAQTEGGDFVQEQRPALRLRNEAGLGGPGSQ